MVDNPPISNSSPTSTILLELIRKGLVLGNSSSQTRVLASVAQTVELAAANANRVSVSVYNESGANLYVCIGVTATVTTYTVVVPPDALYVINDNTLSVSGYFDNNSGAASVTEISYV
jgi:hypothetical protein